MPNGPTTADYKTMIESAPEAIIVYTPEKFLFLNEFEPLRDVGNPVAVENRARPGNTPL